MNEFLFHHIAGELQQARQRPPEDAEEQLQQRLAKITPANEAFRAAARRQWNAHAKPLGSLGVLEPQVEDLCALTGTLAPTLNRAVALIFCADNGVVEEGVSQTGPEVTAIVAHQLAAGNSSVNKMAEVAGVEVFPVDMGMLEPAAPEGSEGILPLSVRQGTRNFLEGPALTRQEAAEAVLRGMDLAKVLKEAGADLLLAGEMGIGNTTTASAVASVLLGKDPEDVTGKGAGLTDTMLQHKVEVIEAGIVHNQPDREDPLGVLSKVGGLDLCGMCGLYLGGAEQNLPVFMDGFPSAVAALCAVRMNQTSDKAIFASHVSAEPAGQMVLEALNKQAPVQAGMRLGEGTGAVAAVPLLRMALAVFQESYTFEEGGIDPYQSL